MDYPYTRGFPLTNSATSCLLLAILSAACSPDQEPEFLPNPHRSAPVLDARLSDEDRDNFYHLPMGTGIFPYYAFMALEDPKTRDLFYRNLDRFGFLTDPNNPAGLPIGMTIEEPGGLPMKAIGVNCAACHVNEYTYEGHYFRVEGAPNLIDLIAFKRDLIAAAEHTLAQPTAAFKLLRAMATEHAETKGLLQYTRNYHNLKEHGDFGDKLASALDAVVMRERELSERTADQMGAETVLNPIAYVQESAHRIVADHSLDERVSELNQHAVPEGSPLAELPRKHRAKLLHETLHQWAYNARLLLSWAKTLERNLAADGEMTPPGPGRADAWGAVRALLFEGRPQTAPSSIPPIWNTADLARYQWNATTNTNVQRGLSAAIGAGAFFDARTGLSPIRLYDLMQLEEYATQFVPPTWPEEYFPPIDAGLQKRGSSLYDQHCARCHNAGRRGTNGLMEYPLYDVSEIGTDATYVKNFAEPVGDEPFAQAMERVLSRMESEYYRTHNVDRETQLKWEPESRRPGFWRSPQAYPALPMDGIWATAPYLHNNSVPTLYDLLLPPAERPKRFYVGSREFDPKKVGFKNEMAPERGGFEFDTTLKGNNNSGHEYGTALSTADRWAIVEYLKTVPSK